jgi:mRNA interferase RelE/StbE
LVWTINYSDSAQKKLKKLDKQVARRIVDFLDERIATLDDPRSTGKALTGSILGEYWRYRVGEYRIICGIQDSELCILVVELGNRKLVYK